ncbi:efflux transporter outer membrane subunit [Rahnella woolbedingensis]|uniref:Multidrug resistance outer membrane protein MdtQ n=1 Tax=Rahnella woolbedingensis TaxID=1510574 RepID=A0A419N5L2_9GAMM|nr:multidrug resistance outer membrane protein MdtQ [Rahnella woolbedingensis]RJT41574.1 multidrug resistance outer membrane protein MdtQ [Rahnella woolbedingensis]
MKFIHDFYTNKIIFPVILFSLFISLGGCAWKHDEKPALPVTDVAQLRTPQIPQAAMQHWPGSDWWQKYHNPQLNQLVAQALKDSPTIAVVQQRVELAKAQVKMGEANDGPQVNFGADVERQKMSSEGVMGPFALDDPAAGTTGPWYTNGTFGLQGSYELDLWGKNRAEIQSALGVAQAKQAELAEARLLVSSAVVEIFWDLQADMALHQMLLDLREQESVIALTNKQLYAEGVTPSDNDTGSQINLAKIDQQIEASDGQIRILQTSLQAMLGLKSHAIALRPVALPAMQQNLPPSLGYELLARRPDLQAAHWYIDASLSEVDAAHAAFYPTINLMGFLQNDALHMSDLFRGSAQQMGLTAGLTLPIFDSGRLNANLGIVRANSNLSIASYNKAVVDAVSEVVKNASQVQALADENAQQNTVVQGREHIFTLATQRFDVGIYSGAEVAKAKLPLLEEQAKQIQLQGEWISADVRLTRALGGGYRAENTDSLHHG